MDINMRDLETEMKPSLPQCLYDNSVNAIASFYSVPIGQDTGTGGVVIRLVELYCSLSLKGIAENFNELTGYFLSVPVITGDEHKFIRLFIDDISMSVNQKKQEALADEDKASRYLSGLKSGVIKLSAGMDMRDEALKCDHHISAAQRKQAIADNYVKAISYLTGMAATLMQPTSESPDREPFSPALMPELQNAMVVFPEVKYAVDRMIALKNALSMIVNACGYNNTSTWYQTAPFKIQCAKTYFGVQGEMLRNQMSFGDYIAWAKKCNDSTTRHLNMISKEINLTGI